MSAHHFPAVARVVGHRDHRAALAVLAVAACHFGSAGQVLTFEDLGDNYADHEILQDGPQGTGLIVFQTNTDAWIGRLDPGSGLFAMAGGREWKVAEGISTLQVSRNGPEFGIDRDGWAVFYNVNVGSRVLIERATPTGGFGSPFVVETLTDATLDRINQLPSQSSTADSTFVVYGLGVPDTFDRSIAYLEDMPPSEDRLITTLSPGTAGFRWARETSLLTSTIGDPAGFGQVVLVDAARDERAVITDDPGVKFDPYVWLAPEADGAPMMIAAVDEVDLAVYRQDEPYWTQIALLSPPIESGMSFIQSAEPFVVAGRSFVVLTLKNESGPIFGGDVTESQIWLYGIEDDPATRFAMRVDDPESPDLVRHEGEAFLADEELFIYYNDVRPSGIGLRMTRTGIRLDLPEPCWPADVAPPFGVLTTDDVVRVIEQVDAGSDAGDADRSGTTDFFDVLDQLVRIDACASESLAGGE